MFNDLLKKKTKHLKPKFSDFTPAKKICYIISTPKTISYINSFCFHWFFLNRNIIKLVKYNSASKRKIEKI